MEAKICPSRNREAEIPAISSKSHVHRLLIAAMLSDRETTIITNTISDDMRATMRCIENLGGEVVIKQNEIRVKPLMYQNTEAQLDCGESGSTARFLLPVAATLLKRFRMTGTGKLPTRPFAPVCAALREHGCQIDCDFLPMNIVGGLKPGVYRLPGDVSSQYISGLLFALPLLSEESRIELSGELQSRSYVDMTIQVLKAFDIKIEEKPFGYKISGNQKYVSTGIVNSEGDWSNAAFFLGMGALGSKIQMTGLNINSVQGDKQILPILLQFNAKVEEDGNSITVSRGKLKAIDIDVSQIPDLVPVLCVIAAGAEGTSYFRNAQRLRLKESDRIISTIAMLKALGGDAGFTERGNSTDLWVNGKQELNGGCVDGMNDHRIVMSSSTAACLCKGNVTICGAEAVNKSYPNFFRDLLKVFGEDNIVISKEITSASI